MTASANPSDGAGDPYLWLEEIEGVPPWRRALVSGATVIKNAATAPERA